MSEFRPFAKGRMTVVVGHYGSGKTEISLALALKAADAELKTTLVDLDIVNPFFRSAEKGELLEKRRVEMVAPPYALTGVDLPVLSARVDSVFGQDENYRVFDVGGDDAGAAALGRFRPRFEGKDSDVFCVVNLFRPFSATSDAIEDMISRIELRSRLQVTGVINNSNLADETRIEDVVKGFEALKTVEAHTGIKIVCNCCLKSLKPFLPDMGVPVLSIDRLLKPDWI